MPTTDPVPSTSPADLLFNAQKIDEAVTGTADTYTDRLGVEHLTMTGAMKKLGYEVPVAFTSGLSITRASQTVTNGGLSYHANPASLPFTTTGTFVAGHWVLISNVTTSDLALKAPIASPTFTGTVTAPVVLLDANFHLSMSGGGRPVINLDYANGTYFDYDRSTGTLQYVRGGVSLWTSTATEPLARSTDATSGNGLVRKSQMDTALTKATSAEVLAGTSSTLIVTPQTLQEGKRGIVLGVVLNGLAEYTVTSIPSWVTRITISMYNVSTSSDQLVGVRLSNTAAPGAFLDAGYFGNAWRPGASANITNIMAASNHANNTDVRQGSMVLTKISNSRWASTSLVGISNVDNNGGGAFSAEITSPLSAVRFMVVSGTFDSGVISVMWE
jgi:hypothetical protein